MWVGRSSRGDRGDISNGLHRGGSAANIASGIAASERRRCATNEANRAQLERKLPAVQFKDNTLADVLEFLPDVSGANIFVDWPGVGAAGASPKTRITYSARDKSLGAVMDELLAGVAETTEPLQFSAVGRMFVVSTAKGLEAFKKEMEVNSETADPPSRAKLDRVLPERHFKANALEDVTDFLQDVTGANLYVEWPALEAAGIERKAVINFKMRDIPLRHALRFIITSAAGKTKQEVGFAVPGHVIALSTRERLEAMSKEIAADAAMVATPTMREVLNRPLPEVHFSAIKFSDAIDFLRDVSGTNLYVDWRALETAGVKRDAPLTLKVRDIPLREWMPPRTGKACWTFNSTRKVTSSR